MSALYTVFIYPLELFFEIVFTIANRIVGNPGWAIIILSLVVNFLVLPLYNRADEVQRQERELEKSLESGIARIKKAFKGDERMMMLQAYYRENNYSPVFIMKSSVSLLLQIPFFMAAYNFLSHLLLLRGAAFGPIADLGSPDHLCEVMGISINVLPVIMTLINVVSGYIYTKGMPLKSKIQLYGMALLFLVLLYNSPSGLAFYWTLNNVFSLFKNALYKLKKPGFVFSVFCAFTGIVMAVYINTLYDTPFPTRRLRLTILALALLVPLLIHFMREKGFFGKFRKIGLGEYSKSHRNIFILSGSFLTVLTGAMIPASVVKVSPTEFMDIMNLRSPNTFVIHSLLIAAGFFVVWGGVFFSLAGKSSRVIMSYIWWALCPASAVTYLFFGTDLGEISVNFVFYEPLSFAFPQKVINLLVIAAVFVVMFILFRCSSRVTEGIAIILVIVAVVMSGSYMMTIDRSYRELLSRRNLEIPQIPLSSTGQNVMVLMLDRAPGFMAPIIFNELPELQEQFDGFTVYPNTLSFGNHTKFGAPALFGGYDYTTSAICADDTRTLRQKHDEALAVMPAIFSNEGFEVTLLDPPYAGYLDDPDLGIFEELGLTDIHAYHALGVIEEGFYNFNAIQEKLWERNYFCYSLFKISPLFVQETVYNNGLYNEADVGMSYEWELTIPQVSFGNSSSWGVLEEFMESYEVLTKLSDITVIEDDVPGTFMYMDNDATHFAMLLQAPEYIPAQSVDNTEYDAAHRDRFEDGVNGYALNMDQFSAMQFYTSNAGAYIQLGQYFDYLREQGVWDNTRIIIVADHGIMYRDCDLFYGQLRMGMMGIDAYNPILMVKDFGSTGFEISDEFMTNADVPYLAVNGIVEDPVNPFTGNPITMEGMHNMPMYVINSEDWNVNSTDTIAGADALRFCESDWYRFDGTQVIDTEAWEFDGIR
ncbi:MAG: membrane protein insertase YidC [Clostridiales bacterium]|nr:membrane protein insertase YidC [Clostridiales bacterium]